MAVKDRYDARDPGTAAWLSLNDVPFLGVRFNERGQGNWVFDNTAPYSDAAWQLALQWRYQAEGDREALTGYLPEFLRAYQRMTAAVREARRGASGTGTEEYDYDRRSA